MPFEIEQAITEAEAEKILRDKTYANEKGPFGLTRLQIVSLQLLSTPEDHKITANQRKIIEMFLHDSMGKMDLNKKLRSMLYTDLKEFQLNKKVIEDISYFIYKTRRVNQISAILEKVTETQRRIDNNIALDERHKISFMEYSVFVDGARLNKVFTSLQKKVQYDSSSHIGKIHEKITRADELNKKMEKSFSQSFKVHPGTFSTESIKKKAIMQGEVLSFFERIVTKIITKHKHTSKLYENKEKEATLSHINPNPTEDKFLLRDYLYTDVYQIKIENLISSKNKKVLQEIYGANWLEQLREKYARIEREIHDNTAVSFAGLLAQPEDFQKKSGRASLLPFGLGHLKIKKTSFSEVHRRILDRHYKNNEGRMLCSEFVAQCTIAAMVELNKQLAQDAAAKKVNFVGKPVKIPISKHEDLSLIQPDRFIKILKSKGCVEKRKKAPEVAKYFKKT